MVVEERREVAHDETPALIVNHAFVPRAEWWSLCKVCGLAQAAHAETTVHAGEELRKIYISYCSDDNPEEFE